MATGERISTLTAASNLAGTDVLAGVQVGGTRKFSLSSILSWIQGQLTKVDVGLENVANVLQYSASNPPKTVGSISLSASWSGAGPYTQMVTVTGATVTGASKVDLQLTAAQISSLITAGVTGLVIENNAGTLTAYAVGASPSAAMTVQCTVEETQ